MKRLRVKIRFKKTASLICVILFYFCFVAKVDSDYGVAVIATILLSLAGILLVSAAYDKRRLIKIQERRSSCFSKMLAYSEL